MRVLYSGVPRRCTQAVYPGYPTLPCCIPSYPAQTTLPYCTELVHVRLTGPRCTRPGLPWVLFWPCTRPGARSSWSANIPGRKAGQERAWASQRRILTVRQAWRATPGYPAQIYPVRSTARLIAPRNSRTGGKSGLRKEVKPGPDKARRLGVS